MTEKGLSSSKAATVAAVIELGNRIASLEGKDRDRWQTRLEMIAKEVRFCDRDDMGALPGRRGKGARRGEDILRGLSGAYLDIPVFYRKAVRINAYGVVLLHVHPGRKLFRKQE